ncbi:pyridine nucleotide-disulfide oxidoreductase [Spirochaetia bacterium]|nr:pyridine nucleotide-disulfide oxidoreductase [Spirochaetia bacterium]
MSDTFDVAVIGAGPAGLAAAIAAEKAGASVLLLEREGRPGGILKQCIHDGFGLLRFGEKLSGPEYAHRFIKELPQTKVTLALNTFVTKAAAAPAGFTLNLVGREGVGRVTVKALVLATGCRERTARQIAIHGTRPAGVLTAGTAQYYVNILGQLPCRRCVILGSGDIGLIMARRLTLEGAEVLGVYEAKSSPSGLSRNIAQCLNDFDIPLHTSATVTKVFGRRRLEAVEVADVDEKMRPIAGTERRIACDGLILSVGLIPENELAESLGVPLDGATKGPVTDQNFQTLAPGIFCCGNALQVNDLVDYVSESGETAGQQAALHALNGGKDGRRFAEITASRDFLSLVPQRIDMDTIEEETTVFFRSREERENVRVRVLAGEREIFRKDYRHLRPPEMEKIGITLKSCSTGEKIHFVMEAAKL